MKTLAFLVLLALSTTPALAGNWFGSGPWANATYYPGNLDGKYQAAISGANTAGVLGFAITDGAPPFLSIERQSAGTSGSIVSNQELELNRTVNYYAVFINGRTFTGTTLAGINYDNSSVSGNLIGSEPTTLTNTTSQVTSQLITNITPTFLTNTNTEITTQLVTNVTSTNIVTTNITITNTGTDFETNIIIVTNTVALSNVETVFVTNQTLVPVTFTNTNTQTTLFTNTFLDPVSIATGVDGSFQANITGKRGIFTFQGPGQLSFPGPVIDGQQANPVRNFNVNGIRVSFSSQATFQSLGGNNGAAR
jgi:hypothetical protein